MLKEEYEAIKNDLEVLEILKENFYEEYKLPNGKISLLFRLNENNKFLKLKEWLENESKRTE